ncbi:MAG: hypothetical protein K6F35_11760 [Lachnospiraceae bacterium]|nr:hypothetical protein [Lachnospiraceae bacterium]
MAAGVFFWLVWQKITGISVMRAGRHAINIILQNNGAEKTRFREFQTKRQMAGVSTTDVDNVEKGEGKWLINRINNGWIPTGSGWKATRGEPDGLDPVMNETCDP